MDFFNNLNYDAVFPFALAGIITLLFVALGLLIRQLIQRNINTVNYDEQLQELMSSDFDDEESSNKGTKINIVVKWNRYWGRLFKEAGISRYNSENNTAGRDVLLIGVIAAVIISLILQNLIIGPLASVATIFAVSFLMKQQINKKSDKLNEQLPGFIFALKAQIQASSTNERAMLKVIDAMPSPLYDDLKVVRNKLLASSPFREALEELSKKTASRDLQFLAACMIQATTSGSNLEHQLDSIQRVLDSRRKVTSEINKAVKAAQPAMWVSSIAIPFLFIISYLQSAQAREFWFNDPVSYLVLIAVIVLYGASMWLVKGQVDKIKNF